MRFRALHLATVLLLLTTLGPAEGVAPHVRGYSCGAHYLGMLVAQERAAIAAQHALPSASEPGSLLLSSGLAAQQRLIWTMRPPAAHSLHLQAVTSFSV